MGETAQQLARVATREALPGVTSLVTSDERIDAVWAMSPEQRIAAANRGELTLGEMLEWAARRPHEVPIVDDEFFFITALSADAEEEDAPADAITGEQFWGGAMHPLPATATPSGRQS